MLSKAGRTPKGETMALIVRNFPTELNEELKGAIRMYAPGMSKEEVVAEAVGEWIRLASAPPSQA